MSYNKIKNEKKNQKNRIIEQISLTKYVYMKTF